MLACAADKILAAPFSIVGSIGVIAGAPNVHRLLEKGGVDYVQRTAGEYKRTINMLTPNTEEGLKKFDEELALIHDAFIVRGVFCAMDSVTQSLGFCHAIDLALIHDAFIVCGACSIP
jgi:hypothetical protein